MNTAFSAQDLQMMRRALSLAEKACGQTSPNPAVGAVITYKGEIVGEGFHKRAGAAHAEVVAIRQAEEKGFSAWEEATLYCTLEPCSTIGRTGACSTAIITKGISRVVYASTDPNPKHAGAAEKILQEQGVEVTRGVMKDEGDFLIRGFRSVFEKGRPWVIIKSAMSLDGKITRPLGEGQWLTSAESREKVHELRAEVDAIITSGATVREDDPALTVRLPKRGEDLRQPLPVIMTREKAYLPSDAQLLKRSETLIYDKSLSEMLADLGRRGVNTVLVEAGGELLGSFIDAGVVDEVVFYYAPLLTGGEAMAVAGKGAENLLSALKVEKVSYKKIKDDVMMRGMVSR